MFISGQIPPFVSMEKQVIRTTVSEPTVVACPLSEFPVFRILTIKFD